MTPEAIPVHPAESVAELAPEAVATLFGRGYALRGSERVRLVAGGSAPRFVAVRPGPSTRARLDAAERTALPNGPLRLIGPKGRLDAPPPDRLGRRLVLPTGMMKAWGLKPGEAVAVQLGALILATTTEAGDRAGLHLGPTDRLAADAPPGTTARLRRDVALAPEQPETPPTHLAVARRLITETDVRQARLKGKRITLRPDQLITPSARALGRELGVLDP